MRVDKQLPVRRANHVEKEIFDLLLSDFRDYWTLSGISEIFQVDFQEISEFFKSEGSDQK